MKMPGTEILRRRIFTHVTVILHFHIEHLYGVNIEIC